MNLPFEESFTIQYLQQDLIYKVKHPRERNDFYHMSIESQNIHIKASIHDNQLAAIFDDQELNAYFYKDEHTLFLFHEGNAFHFKRKASSQDAISADLNNHALIAPMPGVISKIWVKAGEKVQAGAKLVALEAMKMEHTVFSPSEGLIKSIHYQIGDQVEEGCELIDFE